MLYNVSPDLTVYFFQVAGVVQVTLMVADADTEVAVWLSSGAAGFVSSAAPESGMLVAASDVKVAVLVAGCVET